MVLSIYYCEKFHYVLGSSTSKLSHNREMQGSE